MLAKSLKVLLNQVAEDFETETDLNWAYFLSKEIKEQFKQLEKDYKKCKKIAAKNEHYFHAIENRMNTYAKNKVVDKKPRRCARRSRPRQDFLVICLYPIGYI